MSTALGGTLRDERRVRIGFTRIFTAQRPSDGGPTFDQTIKFDTDAPPTGFRDLGATGDDTSIEATKEVFSLRTGILRTRKFQAVIGLEGTINAILHEYDAVAINDALAGDDPFNILRPSPVASGIASVTSKSAFDLAVGEGANFVVGDRIAVAASGALLRTINTTRIQTLVTDAVTLEPALFFLPLVTDLVQKVDSRKLAVGTSLIPRLQLVMVHDFALGAGQIVYHFPDVTAAESGFRPDFAGGRENVKLPLIFAAFGVTDPDFGDTVVFTVHDFD